MKIGVVGTGTIASAVVKGIAGQGHQIIVSERSVDRATKLAAQFDEVQIADNQTVLDRSEVIFLGLMAEQAEEILGSLSFGANHKVVSLMAGATMAQVAEMVAPATAKAVMMPFPGIAKGGSPIMALGDTALLSEIFSPGGNEVFALANDAELIAYLSAQAVLSPAVQMVNDAAGWLGNHVSDPAQGERFLRMLVGSSLLASETGPMIQALSTPGGYNARLREHMVDQGMTNDLRTGLNKLLKG